MCHGVAGTKATSYSSIPLYPERTLYASIGTGSLPVDINSLSAFATYSFRVSSSFFANFAAINSALVTEYAGTNGLFFISFLYSSLVSFYTEISALSVTAFLASSFSSSSLTLFFLIASNKCSEALTSFN
jgi:hypothetical protein